MSKVLLFASVAIAAVTSPVLAREAKSVEGAKAETSQPAPTASATPAKKMAEQKYCVLDTVTGSRIAYKICKTRAEWLDQDFDPLAK